MLHFCFFGVACRPSSLWLSEIHATTLRRSLRLPKTYCYRGGGTGEWLPLFAELSFSQQKQDRTPMPVTNNMEFGFSPPFVRPIRHGESPYWAGLRRAVNLEMGGVDHQGAIKKCFICQLNENFIKNTEPNPPVKRLSAFCAGRTHQMHPSTAVRAWWRRWCRWRHACHPHGEQTGKERFYTLQLTFGKIKQGTRGIPQCLLHTLFFFPWKEQCYKYTVRIFCQTPINIKVFINYIFNKKKQLWFELLWVCVCLSISKQVRNIWWKHFVDNTGAIGNPVFIFLILTGCSLHPKKKEIQY